MANANPKAMSESDIERQQIEWVFGLTGGELDRDPSWTVWEPVGPMPLDGADPVPNEMRQQRYAYSYDGAPDYSDEAKDYDNQYNTVLCFGGGFLPMPTPWLADGQGIWELVQTFNSSGECECPNRQWDPIERESPTDNSTRTVTQAEAEYSEQRDECPLCEEKVGEEHGYIYIGEGYEAVYRRVQDEDDSEEE